MKTKRKGDLGLGTEAKGKFKSILILNCQVKRQKSTGLAIVLSQS
jgi:hypothetical protein